MQVKKKKYRKQCDSSHEHNEAHCNQSEDACLLLYVPDKLKRHILSTVQLNPAFRKKNLMMQARNSIYVSYLSYFKQKNMIRATLGTCFIFFCKSNTNNIYLFFFFSFFHSQIFKIF